MAIKYLSGNRIQGTNAERLALTTTNFSDAFPSLEQDGSSGFAGAGAGGSKTDSPINGQNSLYFDPQNKAVSGTNPTTYLGGLGSTTRWKELPKEDFSVAMWIKAQSGTGYNQMAEEGYEGDNGAVPVTYGDILGNSKAWESDTQRRGNGLAIGIQKDGTEEMFIHLASNGNESGIALNKYFTSGDVCPHDDDWHHYVFTFDNTNSLFSVYRDAAGTAIDTQAYANNPSGTMTTSTATFDVGRHGSGNGNLLRQAFICDVSIWGRILTAGERTILFNGYDPTAATSSSNTGKNVLDSGIDTSKCYVWWKMGDWAVGTDGFAPSSTLSYTYHFLVAGTIFEETGTRRHWVWNGSNAWNEVL